MEYSIKQLADLAGISTRTLRWYDKKGLLKPSTISASGYRRYNHQSVVRLQQILFYKELDIPLEQIKKMLNHPQFDQQEALQSHLFALIKRRDRINALILTVEHTLKHLKGGTSMPDPERFKAFKTSMVQQNEEKYGEEIRQSYGDDAVNSTHQAIMGLTQQEYTAWRELENNIGELLEQAVQQGECPNSQTGQHIAQLHRKWCTYTMGNVSPAQHAGLAQLYVADQRFTDYYDRNVKGCAVFLRDAILGYSRQK